jgi:hypothetical protein
MKLFTQLRDNLTIITQLHKQLIALLKESLQIHQERLTNEKTLLKELEYLYQLLILHHGHRLQFHVVPPLPFLVLAVGNKEGNIIFNLYVPKKRIEVAMVLINITEGTFIIEEIEYKSFIAKNKQVSIMFVQQIISEAKKMGIQQIAVKPGQPIPAEFSETIQLLKMMDLPVIPDHPQ